MVFNLMLLITACEKKAENIDYNSMQLLRSEKMNDELIKNPSNLPSQVSFSNEQKKYLFLAINSTIKIISGEAMLKDEEHLFGQGKYIFPKNPGPIQYRYFPETPYIGFGISFERRTEKEIWLSATLGFHPENFPTGVYLMNLSKDFYENLILENSQFEERPEESIEKVNIFRYHLKENKNIKLLFEAREDVSSLKDNYPKSFHIIKFIRNDNS